MTHKPIGADDVTGELPGVVEDRIGATIDAAVLVETDARIADVATAQAAADAAQADADTAQTTAENAATAAGTAQTSANTAQSTATAAGVAAAAAQSTANTVAANLGTETTARIAGDGTNATAIGAETTRATAAEGALQTNITAEATLARNADNLTSGTVADARIAGSIARDSEVVAAVAAEATARDTAIAVQHIADKIEFEHARLSSLPLNVYGDSFTDRTLNTVTPGKFYFDDLATALDAGAVTTYGVSGTRINHGAGSVIASGALPGLSAKVAGSVWPGVSSRPGLVIGDWGTNDIGHYAGGSTPAIITGAGGTRYLNAIQNLYQTFLAVVSSETRIEQAPTATVVYTGAWSSVTAGATYCSGGTYAFTTTVGRAVNILFTSSQIAQSGPLAGRVWLSTLQFDPASGTNAIIGVSIDGGAEVNWTPTDWEVYGANTTINAVIPVQLPVDGAQHTVTFTHRGSAGHFFIFDAAFAASETPPKVLIMAPPDPVAGSWSAGNVLTWKANRALVEPKIRAAVALFGNAYYVPCNITTNGISSIDGVHPNDRGMEQRAGDAAAMIRQQLDGYLAARRSQVAPDANYAML